MEREGNEGKKVVVKQLWSVLFYTYNHVSDFYIYNKDSRWVVKAKICNLLIRFGYKIKIRLFMDKDTPWDIKGPGPKPKPKPGMGKKMHIMHSFLFYEFGTHT